MKIKETYYAIMNNRTLNFLDSNYETDCNFRNAMLLNDYESAKTHLFEIDEDIREEFSLIQIDTYYNLKRCD